MKPTKPTFDNLLAFDNLAELRAAVVTSRLAFSLTQVQNLSARIEEMAPPTRSLRLAIARTYTSELLDPWLRLEALLHGLDLNVYHAPYGLVAQEAQEGSGLVTHLADITLLLLQREDLHPDLAKPLTGFTPGQQSELRALVLSEVERIVTAFRKQSVGHLVFTILPERQARELGDFDAQSERSEGLWWALLQAEIGALLRDSVGASLLLDLDEVMRQIGRTNFFDKRLWYSARFPFTPEASREVARRIINFGAVVKLPKAKVIVLDADNTLWGGVIGEEGMDGIALGPEYPGNTFVDFQRRLLGFQQRGFILALCSKNNGHDVEEVLRKHPHQVLRERHFAASRVNWLPKPENLMSLAEELKLGLDSFIFLDDSDHECARMRQLLPQVEVIQTPARCVDIPSCLDHVARLEVTSLTPEDSVRTDLYQQEHRRRESKADVDREGSGLAHYLASLNMKMHVSLNKAAHLARLSQMTLKTNQFNLTTRRYSESQILAFISGEQWVVADFALTDAFGNSGVVGLAILHCVDRERAVLDTLLMSCRVIGRGAESAFLHGLLRYLAERGVEEVVADYVPTAKNELVSTFLSDEGFERRPDGRYCRHLGAQPPRQESAFPIAMTLDA